MFCFVLFFFAKRDTKKKLKNIFNLLNKHIIDNNKYFIDYLLAHPTTINTKKGPLIHLETLWPVVQEMGEVWTMKSSSASSITSNDSNSMKGATRELGDVWPCKTLQTATGSNEHDHFVSFHRLSQWLVYS